MGKVRAQALLATALFIVAAVGQTIARTPASAGTFPGINGRIAFAASGHIQVIRSDGTGRVTLNEASPASTIAEPAWNATGGKLAYRSGGSDIRSINADGTNSRSLVGMPSFAANPTWSADGSVVAFDGYIGGINQENRIYTVPAAGGSATELVDLDARDPTFSPDGTKIAYVESVGASDIGVMNADGSGAVNITIGAGGNNSDHDPSWSPDGTQIAFRRAFDIWTVNADGSSALQLTTGGDAEHPTWSPDGTQIAFQRDDDIWVMNSDGSDAVNITNSPDVEDRAPDWGIGGSGTGIGFSASAYEGSEDGGGARRLLGAAITLVRTGSTVGMASVRFATSDGTAKSSSIRRCRACDVPPPDYLKASGTLVFADGQTTATFRVPITDDGRVEGDETVNLTLTRARGGAAPGPITTAVLTISDNDPNISFDRASSSGSEEVGSPRLNVLLSSPASGATVAYSVTGGTATPGEDFTLAAGTLGFGTRASSIPLRVLDDDLKEGPETVVVELSTPTNAELGPITVRSYTIRDDDPQGDTAGDTPATARTLNLVSQPRQELRESLPASDVDVFRVHLEATDDLAIDIDPGGRTDLDSIVSSTLTILGPDGTTELAVVGGSPEPDGSGPTDNAAHLFTAASTGDHFLRISSDARGGLYQLRLHRLALAEGFQEPAVLDSEGSMFAWLRGNTLGITGPTGYGFALEGAWTKVSTFNARSGTFSSVYSLPTGATVDLSTAFGDLRMQSLGPIVVSTGRNLWGDTFGKVVGAIPLRLGIPLGALQDTLRDEFGLELAVSALEYWQISMGSEIMNGGRGFPSGVEQLMPGVPYLWFNDEPAIAAMLGDVRIEHQLGEQRVLLILDPTDPFLYIRSEDAGEVKKPTLAFSRGGRIPFHPDLTPTIPSAVGVTDFYSHVFTSAGAPPNPALAEYFTIFADGSLDVDANDDGNWLAGEGNANQLFNGDLSAFGEVLRDVNVGANARVIFHYNSDRNQFDFETPLGRATAVYNGLEETLWFRGRKGPEVSPLDGTPLEFLNLTQEDFFEGTINSAGEFSVIGGTSFVSPAADFVLTLRLDNDGIEADLRGGVEMTGRISYQGASASCTAKAQARGLLAFSYSNSLQMSGSVGLDGSVKCYVGDNKVASASIDLSGSIDDGKLEFRLPLIGQKSVTLF